MVDKVIIAFYGLFLLSGAYFGLKAGSKISLIMGLVSGLLTFAGLYVSTINPKNGFLFLVILSGILGCVFLIRLLKTQQFMPAGMLLVVSLAFLVFCLCRFLKV